MIFRVFNTFRVFLKIFYHKNSHFSALKYPCFFICNSLFCQFHQKTQRKYAFFDYTTTKKCEKNNINIEKNGKIGKKKKNAHLIYKACALLSADCSE